MNENLAIIPQYHDPKSHVFFLGDVEELTCNDLSWVPALKWTKIKQKANLCKNLIRDSTNSNTIFYVTKLLIWLNSWCMNISKEES